MRDKLGTRSITSGCLENEPALLPRKRGWTREDSFVNLNQSDNARRFFRAQIISSVQIAAGDGSRCGNRA